MSTDLPGRPRSVIDAAIRAQRLDQLEPAHPPAWDHDLHRHPAGGIDVDAMERSMSADTRRAAGHGPHVDGQVLAFPRVGRSITELEDWRDRGLEHSRARRLRPAKPRWAPALDAALYLGLAGSVAYLGLQAIGA